jgi:integrase
MPRPKPRPLTPQRIAMAQALSSTPGRVHDGRGLYLQTSEFRTLAWVFRYQFAGRPRHMGLGSLDDITLAQARRLAAHAREQIQKGIDPVQERRNKKTAAAKKTEEDRCTFSWAVEEYLKTHEQTFRNVKHRKQWATTLRRYCEPIARVPVREIETAHIVKTLMPVWTRIPATASRLRGRIERVLAWAQVSGFREGDNPARWRDHLKEALPAPTKLKKVEHHAALAYAELPQFMATLRQREALAARALDFLILTAARSGEVLGATWAEIDLAQARWTIPASRMKAGKRHQVPLSVQAITLLRSLPREAGNEHLLVGRDGTGLSNASMLILLRRMGRSDITPHGFRSCFTDWAHERSTFPNTVIDMSLAHAIGDRVEAAYRRGDLWDKRRRLMEAWATYCATPTTAKAGEVVPLRGRK